MDDQKVYPTSYRTMLTTTALDVVAVAPEKVKAVLSDFLADDSDHANYELQLLKDLDNGAVVTKELEGDGYWKRNVA